MRKNLACQLKALLNEGFLLAEKQVFQALMVVIKNVEQGRCIGGQGLDSENGGALIIPHKRNFEIRQKKGL